MEHKNVHNVVKNVPKEAFSRIYFNAKLIQTVDMLALKVREQDISL